MSQKAFKKALLVLTIIFLSIAIFDCAKSKMNEKEKITVDDITIIKVCIDGKLFVVTKGKEGPPDIEQIFINDKIPVSCLSE